MDAILSNDAVGQWVTVPRLAEWTGREASAIGIFRTHLNRYKNAHLPEGSAAPFTRASGQDLRPARGREVHYRVSAECAEQWTRLRDRIGTN